MWYNSYGLEVHTVSISYDERQRETQRSPGDEKRPKVSDEKKLHGLHVQAFDRRMHAKV